MSQSGNEVLPSDLIPYDDYLFVDDEILYSAIDDVDIWYGFENDQGFPNYIPTTTDPGGGMFLFVVIYSVILMMAVPVLVVLGRRYEQKRKERLELEKEGAAGRRAALSSTGRG